MSLIHGQNITAEEVEREISRWEAARFASLCNVITWASSASSASSLPSFTERVNVPDSGIDAEWAFDVAPSVMEGSFIRVGTNIFQYKKREVGTQSRSAVVSKLLKDVGGAIVEVECRGQREIASYILFTNVHLTPQQIQKFRETILSGSKSARHVEVVDAAVLGSMLNNLPHIRSAFFATGAFRSWEESFDAHRQSSIFSRSPLVGRDALLANIRAAVDDPTVYVIALVGPHMYGKTRLALEATRHLAAHTVEALDPNTLGIDDLRRLESDGHDVIVLTEDPEAEQAERLSRTALARSGIKLIVTVPVSEAAPAPSFGLDSRVRVFEIPSLDDESGRALLHSAGGRFDWSLESWVLDQAGGVPGVLIAAAQSKGNLRESGGTLLDQIGESFERHAAARLPPDDLEGLRIVSILSHLGVEGQARVEAETLCAWLQFPLGRLLSSLDRLRGAGLLRRSGSYVETLPTFLADRFAGQAVLGRSCELLKVLADLSPPAQRRLVRRFVRLRSPDITAFWEVAFGENGPFGSLTRIAADPSLFRLAAPAAGASFAKRLLGELTSLSVDERRAIGHGYRRDLVWALENMLLREETSDAALRALGLLGEVENENYGNNASGLFAEAFSPLHPQVPLSLDSRIAVLREFAGSDQSEMLGLLAIEAASHAVGRQTAIMLRPSTSAAPLGATPRMTWGEVWAYQENALMTMETLTHDARPTVRLAAARALPTAISYFVQIRPELAMPYFSRIIDQIVAGHIDFDITETANTLGWARRALERTALGHTGDASENPDQVENQAVREIASRVAAELADLTERLSKGSYSVRLRRWVGGWSHEGDDGDSSSFGQTQRRHIEQLAEETCATPHLLSPELLDWLRSDDADRAWEFWRAVGRIDSEGAWRNEILRAADRPDGAAAFAGYLSGLAERNQADAAALFGRADTSSAAAWPLLHGAIASRMGDAGAMRIATLLNEGRLDRRAAVNVLTHPQWINEVSPEAFIQVGMALTGGSLAEAGLLFRIMYYRLNDAESVSPEIVDFAWRCLEARSPTPSHNDDYYCDAIASRLAEANPERGFRLLEACLADGPVHQKVWNPLEQIGATPPQFWQTLLRTDRSRAINVVLDAAGRDDARGSDVSWHLPGLLDLESDADILAGYASRGEREALAVCDAMSGEQKGFWSLAFRLVDAYPKNDAIQRRLESSIEFPDHMVAGPMHTHLSQRLQVVESAASNNSTPHGARVWLGDYAIRLREVIKKERQRHEDQDVNF